jgi:iron complex outermembrane recepter protein
MNHTFIGATLIALLLTAGTGAVADVTTTDEYQSTQRSKEKPTADAGDLKSEFWDRFHLAQVDQGSSANPSVGEKSNQAVEKKAAPLDEIIVTARKESERLQDVPISITALSAETLQRSGIESIADVGREVPGLNVVTVGPGQNQLVIRGVSSYGGVPTVGYYIDDTPIESIGNEAGGAMDPSLFDLERVEVLRGPQGTLYGASSMGGTVKYITGRPNLLETQATVKSTLSDTDGGGLNYEVSSLLNEPLVPGHVAVRAIAFYRDEDGYIDRYPVDPNNYLGALAGPVTKNVNTEKSYGMRLGLEIAPNESFSVRPSVWIQRTRLGAPFTIDDPPGSFDSLIQTRDVNERIDDQLSLIAVTVEGNVDGVQLTSSTSYRSRAFDAIEDESKFNDFEFSPAPQTYVYPLGFDNYFSNHDFTEEFRGSGKLGPVHGLLGLFYLHQHNLRVTHFPIPAGYDAAFNSPFGDQPFFFYSDEVDLIEQKAVFGEVNIDVTQKLQATLGLRVFDITQTDNSVSDGVFAGGSNMRHGTSKSTGTNPKYELSYRLTPSALLYVTAAKGFRQGGPIDFFPAGKCGADLAAIGLSGPPTSFNPDTLWNYEFGAKTAWLDNRLTINASVYYIDWNNIQQLVVLPTCGADFTGNFGSAVSKGSELEIQYEPTPALHLSLGTAYNRAELVSTIAGGQGSAGDTLENAPRWMASASADYTKQIDAATSGYARLDLSTSTRQFNNFETTSIYYHTGGYSLANLRFGAKHENWDAALFIQNALNKHAETALPGAYSFDLPTTRRISVNRPRTIGLQVKYDFR